MVIGVPEGSDPILIIPPIVTVVVVDNQLTFMGSQLIQLQVVSILGISISNHVALHSINPQYGVIINVYTPGLVGVKAIGGLDVGIHSTPSKFILQVNDTGQDGGEQLKLGITVKVVPLGMGPGLNVVPGTTTIELDNQFIVIVPQLLPRHVQESCGIKESVFIQNQKVSHGDVPH